MCDIGSNNDTKSLFDNWKTDNCIDTKQWIHILKQIHINKVHIIGIEPLLYKDFNNLIEQIHKLNIKITLTTNGFLYEKYQQSIIKYCDLIWVSIDGFKEETHDYYRGVMGSYKKAIYCINHLKEHNKNVQISSCILPNNIQEIPLLDKLMWDKNIPIVFNHLNFIHPLSSPSQQLCSNLKYIDLKDYNIDMLYESIKSCNKNSIFSPNLITKKEIDTYYNTIPTRCVIKKSGCKVINELVLKKRFIINANGDLLLGNKCWINLKLGNVLEYLKDTNKQNKVRKISDNIKTNGFSPLCQRLCCGGKLI